VSIPRQVCRKCNADSISTLQIYCNIVICWALKLSPHFKIVFTQTIIIIEHLWSASTQLNLRGAKQDKLWFYLKCNSWLIFVILWLWQLKVICFVKFTLRLSLFRFCCFYESGSSYHMTIVLFYCKTEDNSVVKCSFQHFCCI